MPLKQQLINYFVAQKMLSGNMMYFDEILNEKKIHIKKSNIVLPQQIEPQRQLTESINTSSNQNLEQTPISNDIVLNDAVLGDIMMKDAKPNQIIKNPLMRKITEVEVTPTKIDESINTIEALKESIQNCQNCILGVTRQNIVFGEGDINADLMIIGEAPGADEDEQGMPFVGRAGKLLTDILKAVNFERNEVYIANICKCRPPGNRKPLPEEIAVCEPYLYKQIELIKPKIILALGATAAEALFKIKIKMGDVRGQELDFMGIPTIITYHPAALLRNPNWKRPVWEDVQLLRKRYDILSGTTATTTTTT